MAVGPMISNRWRVASSSSWHWEEPTGSGRYRPLAKAMGRGPTCRLLGMERREEMVLWQLVRTEHKWVMATWGLGGEAWDLGAQFELQDKLNEWKERRGTDTDTGSPFVLVRMSFGCKWQKKKSFILGKGMESLCWVCVREECFSYPVLRNKLSVNLVA